MTTTQNTSMSYDIAQGILVTLDDADLNVGSDISTIRDIASFTITAPDGQQYTVAVSPAADPVWQPGPILGLTVGTTVRHANPDLADWEGQIQANLERRMVPARGRRDLMTRSRGSWASTATASARSPAGSRSRRCARPRAPDDPIPEARGASRSG